MYQALAIVHDESSSSLPAQTYEDENASRPPTTPIRASGVSADHNLFGATQSHHETLAVNKAAGDANRSLEEQRTHSLERLCAMKSRCIICKVLGQIPCRATNPIACRQGIFGYQSQYVYEGQSLNTVYTQQFKKGLKSFDAESQVCWICYMPFSCRPHSLNDATCEAQKDILNPIAWALFCLPIVLPPPEGKTLQAKIMSKVISKDKAIFDSVSRYTSWLSQPHPLIRHTTNLVELCIAFERLYEDKDWP